MKNPSIILRNFVDELELTVLNDEKAYLLEGMIGTCSGVNNCTCVTNNCKCFSDNCKCNNCETDKCGNS